jgi:hypothetical protein
MCLPFSVILQVVVPESTERYDSEHRGPVVFAFVPVSWKGDDGGGVGLNGRDVFVDAGTWATID